MMAEVAQLGLQLEFDPTRIRINIAPTSDFNNDPGFYRLSGVIDRTLPTDAVLHESVSRRWCARADYRPKNLAAYQKDLDASCQTLA